MIFIDSNCQSILSSRAFLLQNVAYAARSSSCSRPMPFAIQWHTCLNLQATAGLNKPLLLNIKKDLLKVVITVSANYKL